MILPDDHMDAIDLASSSDKDDTKEIFIQRLEYNYQKYVEKKTSIRSYTNYGVKKLYLVIDGKNLLYVLADKDLSRKFFKIGMLANSVICCRVSPKQKSQVVRLAKENGKWVTLSIGDGANDVPMIMEADIGIGVYGKEGTQAIRSSDYAIGQFRFLQRMLLVHGRWGYRRISFFIYYYFYKNMVVVFTELYFAIYSGFSGQLYFPDLLPLCYNAFWTSWPCVFAYSIERDVDDETSLKFPILYQAGQQKFYFSLKKFWIWIMFAVIHGVMIFYGVSLGKEMIINDTGYTHDHWLFSTLCFCSMIHLITYKIFIDLKYWNSMTM